MLPFMHALVLEFVYVCLVDGAINEWLWWMAGDLVDGRRFGGWQGIWRITHHHLLDNSAFIALFIAIKYLINCIDLLVLVKLFLYFSA